MRSRRILFTAVPACLALAVAACGGSNTASVDQTPAKAPATRSATVDVANTNIGTVLVDAQGRTIYLFQKDAGTKSACFGACAVAWPPVRAAGKPTAGSGLTASLLGTTKRSDGKPQVTYNGHPLYLFQGDKQPGDTNGQGVNAFGAGWFVLSPAGNEIAGNASSGNGTNGY
jgi:predicted lipoprotein with Yx(FWY)xxD motif